LVITACACRIDPPPTRLYSNRELSGKVSADLQQAQAKGDLSADWKSTVDKQFSTLNDDNATYYLLLEAINCESKRNKQLASQMMTTLDREMAARHAGRSRRTWAASLPAEVASKRGETLNNLK
jgi:hypothetical protein